jgi:hypothetical protein
MQVITATVASMAHNSDRCRSHCPINFVLETFGDKWTLLVIRDLMFHGKRHYGEFLASDEGISTNILADRLQRLERDGVISADGEGQRSHSGHARDHGVEREVRLEDECAQGFLEGTQGRSKALVRATPHQAG